MDKENVVGRVVTCANPDDNGGESLTLLTEFLYDGNPEDDIYLNQTITLHSYCNSASFELCGAILTPSVLRQMADKIEEKMNSVYNTI